MASRGPNADVDLRRAMAATKIGSFEGELFSLGRH